MLKAGTTSGRVHEIGCDDAGRGGIAGPLVIATVFHPDPKYLQHIGATDSKNTDEAARALFLKKLVNDGRGRWGYAAAEADWINKLSLDSAEAQCVQRAFQDLALKLPGLSYPQLRLLVDGDKSFPNLPRELEVKYLPKGDAYVPVIAAASMVARALHDELMNKLAECYPGWGLERHKGYISDQHMEMLYKHGLQPFHRKRSAKTAICTYALKRRLLPPEWVKTS